MKENAIQKILERYNQLKNIRIPWQGHWAEISDYIIPLQNIYPRARGGKRTTYIYDSTALRALSRLAATLHSMLTNPSQRWLAIKTNPMELMSLNEVSRWVQAIEDISLEAINSSNFHMKAQEFYLSLIAFGTGILFLEEGQDPNGPALIFKTLPVSECVIAENEKGFVDVLFREFTMSARNVVRQFGEKACNTKILELADKRPDEEVKMLHAIFPKDDYNKFNKLDKPYASVWIASEWNHVLRESGYYEFPAFVTRWSTAPGEIWGRGPGMEALPDVKTVNKMTKDILEAASKIITPPLDVEYKSYLTPLDATPGKINTRAKGATPVQPLYIVDGKAIPLTDAMVEKIKQSINESFYYDAISLVRADRMTATEVMQRVEENVRILGPTYSRLVYEYLEPLTRRVIGIMARKGLLPEPPQALQRYGAKVKIEYLSPMSRAQRMSDVAAIQRALSFVAAMAQVNPDMLDVFNFDETARHIADITGVPARLLRSRDEVDALRQQRAQAQAMQQQMQMLKDAVEVGKTASEIKL